VVLEWLEGVEGMWLRYFVVDCAVYLSIYVDVLVKTDSTLRLTSTHVRAGVSEMYYKDNVNIDAAYYAL
jgi:hypothetical protein